jgi:hypothetical protein
MGRVAFTPLVIPWILVRGLDLHLVTEQRRTSFVLAGSARSEFTRDDHRPPARPFVASHVRSRPGAGRIDRFQRESSDSRTGGLRRISHRRPPLVLRRQHARSGVNAASMTDRSVDPKGLQRTDVVTARVLPMTFRIAARVGSAAIADRLRAQETRDI